MNDEFHTEDKKPIFLEMDSADKSISTNLFNNTCRPLTLNSMKVRASKSMSDLTPVSLGQTKNSWAQSFIASYNELSASFLKTYFESKNKNFEETT